MMFFYFAILDKYTISSSKSYELSPECEYLSLGCYNKNELRHWDWHIYTNMYKIDN